MRTGVVYTLTGSSHYPRLAVSLASLRERAEYTGHVVVFVGDEAAAELAEKLREFLFPGTMEVIRYKRWSRNKRGRRAFHHADKSFLFDMVRRLTDLKSFLFMDCDTQPIDSDAVALIPDPGSEEITVTRFAKWTTNTSPVKKRLNQFRDCPTCGHLVPMVTANPYPAINTGVFAAATNCQIGERWRTATTGNPVFMCDELTMNLLVLEYRHRFASDRFNFSPKYSDAGGADVKIVHYHGDKHTRTELGQKLWVPVYEQLRRHNIGGLASLGPCGDRHLRKYGEERGWWEKRTK